MYVMTQEVNWASPTNCLGIIILDKNKKTASLIDIICPININISKSAVEKCKKYQYLEIYLKKQQHLKKIQFVPSIIGALGTLYQIFNTRLAKVLSMACVDTIQKEVLLGSSQFLQQILMNMNT
eukprot:1882902-Ditylum_brightwellii.AAC.1